MATISGLKAVTTAGTAVQLSSNQIVNAPVMVKALSTNTGLIYIGQVSGNVSSANGLPLVAKEVVIFQNVTNLSEIWIDCSVNGEGVAWLILSC